MIEPEKTPYARHLVGPSSTSITHLPSFTDAEFEQVQGNIAAWQESFHGAANAALGTANVGGVCRDENFWADGNSESGSPAEDDNRGDAHSEEGNEAYYASDDDGGDQPSSPQRGDEGDERENQNEDRAYDGGVDQSKFEPGNNGGSEFTAEYDQSWGNEEEGEGGTDIEEDGPEVNGFDRSGGGGDAEAEDEDSSTLSPAASMVDAAKDSSVTTRPRQRPETVTMFSFDSEEEETGCGGGGGVQAEMDTATSAVEDLGEIGAIGIGGNYSAKPAVHDEAKRVAAVPRRPIVFPVLHSSMDTATTTIRRQENAELSRSTGLQTTQRGSMAVKEPPQGKPRTFLEIGIEAIRRASGPDADEIREMENVKLRAESAAWLEKNPNRVTRRW
jgi:hypothetical protein